MIPQPNVVWVVDFTRETLSGERRCRKLNLRDNGVREVFTIDVDISLPAERVIRVLEQFPASRGQVAGGSAMAGIPRRPLCELVYGPRDRAAEYSAGLTESEYLCGTVQSDILPRPITVQTAFHPIA